MTMTIDSNWKLQQAPTRAVAHFIIHHNHEIPYRGRQTNPSQEIEEN